MTRKLGLGCLLAVLTVVGPAEPAHAQPIDAQEDLLTLSIEELMTVDAVGINVLGTHTHLVGEWMVGYRYMGMGMTGSLDGTRSVAASEILQSFMVAPTDMRMDMHMLHFMYAPSDNFTLMAMVPSVYKSMDHLTRSGGQFTTTSEGLGDVEVATLYTAYGNSRRLGHRVVLGAGVSLPVGSINERGTTPAGSNQLLPYPMQLGSGTFDLLPSLTYLGRSTTWSWTGELEGTIRLGRNSNGYALGDRIRFRGWGARKLADWIGVTAGLHGEASQSIDGAAPGLNPAMVPTADPTLRGGQFIGVTVGADFYVGQGSAQGNRFSLEFNFPLYESLNGPQLRHDAHLTAGWGWTF